jgi:hypothetical protein
MRVHDLPRRTADIVVQAWWEEGLQTYIGHVMREGSEGRQTLLVVGAGASGRLVTVDELADSLAYYADVPFDTRRELTADRHRSADAAREAREKLRDFIADKTVEGLLSHIKKEPRTYGRRVRGAGAGDDAGEEGGAGEPVRGVDRGEDS